MVSSVLGHEETINIIDLLKTVSQKTLSAKHAALSFLTSRYDLKRMGEDRVAAVAYGLLSRLAPCVIIDAGTAITADFINEKGLHLGGFILAGLRTELDSLTSKARNLPKIRVPAKLPDRIPLSTEEAMLSGVIKTKALGLEALIQHTLEKLKTNPRDWNIVLSGGDADYLKKIMKRAIQKQEVVLMGMAKMVEEGNRVRCKRVSF